MRLILSTERAKLKVMVLVTILTIDLPQHHADGNRETDDSLLLQPLLGGLTVTLGPAGIYNPPSRPCQINLSREAS